MWQSFTVIGRGTSENAGEKKHKPPRRPEQPFGRPNKCNTDTPVHLWCQHFYWVLFSTVTAFLSRKIRQWHFIQRSIFRDAFCPVALCPEFECHVSIDHQCPVQFEIDVSRLSTTSASPAHLKYLAWWLAEWPLTSGWAPAFIRCPILCNRHSTVRSDRAPMLTGFTEAFRPLPIVKDSTRDWCQIYRPSTVVHKRTGAEIMARPVHAVSGQKSLRF